MSFTIKMLLSLDKWGESKPSDGADFVDDVNKYLLTKRRSDYVRSWKYAKYGWYEMTNCLKIFYTQMIERSFFSYSTLQFRKLHISKIYIHNKLLLTVSQKFTAVKNMPT